jgi:hypothetical protein
LDRDELVRQILAMWHRHSSVLLVLLDSVPKERLAAVLPPRP